MLKKNKGFTLVEVMIVVAIIAMLAMVFIPVFLGLKHDSSSKNTTELTVQTENKIEKKDLEKL